MVEERKIIMPYGADVAYHCQKCGGFVDEYGKCQFCGSQNQYRYEPQKSMQLYVELDKGRKFYFNHADTMQYESIHDEINFDRDIGGKIVLGGFDARKGIMHLQGFATEDAIFKIEMMHDSQKFTVNGILPTRNKIFKFGVDYITDWKYKCMFENHGILELDMYIDCVDGWIDGGLPTPEGAICPNCGAPLNKLYGLCDYCGGWVEYR